MKACHCRRIFGWVTVSLMLILSSVPRSVARADIGLPPISPGGSSLGVGKGERTNVRMMEEEVNLTIEPLTEKVSMAGVWNAGYYAMQGKVEAVFFMRNLGATDEALEVWFPLATSVRNPGELPDLAPDAAVQNFQVWVDDLPTPFEKIYAPDLGDLTKKSPWASFPITFPAGKDVTVKVTYTIYPSGEQPFGTFEYILQTGASWKGTIGKAVINVHLPYPVTKESVSQSGKSIFGWPLAPQPPGYVIKDNVIRWQFTNLEPGPKDDILVDVIEPERYQALLDARSRAASEPDSADAQWELAKASAGAVQILKYVSANGGGAELGKQVNVAYRRAIELAPEREDIYVAYLDWLMTTEGWNSLMWNGSCPAELCDQLQRALKRFPNNADLLKMDMDIRMMQGDAVYGDRFPANQTPLPSLEPQQATGEVLTATFLAQTPTLTSTPTVPAPTSTPALPTPTATKVTPQPTAVSAASNQSINRAPQATPAPIQSVPAPVRSLIVFWLPLVLIVVIALAFRLVWLARKQK